MMKSLLKYPWFWTALLAYLSYFDLRSLNGGWVYDDAGSVVKNVVVNGMVDWKEAFTRDYWGTEMKLSQSHKSFRPITTLTLKANYVLGQRIEKYQKGITDDADESRKPELPPSWSFRAVNFLLHGIVTGLITKASSHIFASGDVVSQLVGGSLFAIHPVHAEVVSNVTSRGELLMSIFFLLAFLSFAGTRKACYQRAKVLYTGPSILQQQQQQQSFLFQRLLGIYLVPWLCMTLSMFSKEQGVTTLISLVGWDFLKYHGNLLEVKRKLFVKIQEEKTNESTQDEKEDDSGEEKEAKPIDTSNDIAKWERAETQQFVIRTIILAVQTLIVAGWRYILNGETSPDFIEAQNPAGFAKDRFTRAFSITWVYCLYIRDLLYPYYLSPDWSGHSIDLVTNLKDPRAMVVLALWYFAAQSFWSMIVGADTNTSSKKKKRSKASSNLSNAHNSFWNETTLRQINMSVWAFTFVPFLLSSNILVVVGLMKGDRVIYLPSFGFCLLEAILLSKFRKGAVAMRPAFERRKEQLYWGGYFLLVFQMIILSGKNHERNIAWSNSLRLWEAAYAVNPRSHHTMYNYGYELSIKQRFVESEAVMRPIGSARVDGPTNTFVYTMVLYNLHQCDRANVLLDEAFEVIEEKRREGGTRNTESNLGRSESNLLVAKAHCTDDPAEKGRTLYKAVEADQTNEYAVNIATAYMQKIQAIEEMQKGNAV